MENTKLITPEMYDAHPEFVAVGLKVGDPVPVDLTPEQMADTVDFTITQEFLDMNPGYIGEVGEVIQVPKMPEDPAAPAPTAPTPVTASPAAPNVPTKSPSFSYAGHVIVSDGFREVNGVKFHHIKVDDGTSYDLTDHEYNLGVKEIK